MAKDAGCKGGYTDDDALTVCVEGTGRSHGTHGLVHDKMDKVVGGLVQTKQLETDGKMSLKQAIDAAAQSHTEAFPRSGCSPDCIKAQLNDYYREACPNGRFAAKDKNGRLHGVDDMEHANY